jgi:hypothetical protein
MSSISVGTINNVPFQAVDSVSLTDAQDIYSFTIGGNTSTNAAISVHALNNDFAHTPALTVYRDTNVNNVFDSADQAVEFDDRGIDHSVNALLTPGNYFGVLNRIASSTDALTNFYNIAISTTPQDRPTNVIGFKASLPLSEDVGTTEFTQYIGAHNTSDFFSVHVGDRHLQDITLDGLTSDADIRVIQDKNHNRIVDPGEVIATSSKNGSTPELIGIRSGSSTISLGGNQGIIQGGTDYLIQVHQFSGETNYHLKFHSAPIIS